MDIERIRQMESCLNDVSAANEDLKVQLDRMEAMKEKMTALFSYYGSEAWYEDRAGELPPGIPAGVLSEDLVYDEISAVHALSFQMLELAADILKNWVK